MRGHDLSLSDLSSIGSFVSGAAVVASLVYLAVQIQQNTKHTRALIHQGTAARTNEILIGLMPADYVGVWIDGNGVKATPELVRQRQFYLHCGILVNAMEDQYRQHYDGLTGREQFARACEQFRGLLLEPGMRDYWKDNRNVAERVAPGFCAFVDGLCSADSAEFQNRV
jgi:hypothetical protein